MTWWRRVWLRRADAWIFTTLDNSKGPLATAEATYLTGILRCAAIRHVRKGPKSFFGTVHSYASLGHYDDRAEFSAVTTPAHLRNVDARHLESVVVRDHVLFGPVPYRGGNLDLELGVFSVESRDLTAPIIELLDTMVSIASVSFVDVAKPFVSPLIKGIEALTGLDDDTALEIGLAKTFSPPQVGDYLVLRAPHQSVDTAGWSVTGDGSLVNQSGSVVDDYAYLVFSLCSSQERSDWYEIPEIREAHKRVRDAVRTGKLDNVRQAMAAFRLISATSGDLLATDALRLYTKLAEMVKAALPADVTKSRDRDIGELVNLRLYA